MKEWQHHPMPTETEVEEWYDDPKCRFNLGFLCGSHSNIVAIDIDSAESKRFLEEIASTSAFVTWQYITGNGSRILYRASGLVGSSIVKDGNRSLEILGDGRQTVAPPSIHPNGNSYEWVAGYNPKTLKRPASIPPWLSKLLTQRVEIDTQKSEREGWKPLIVNDIHKGTRDNTLAQLAGHLLAPQSLPTEEVYEWLKLMNQVRCKPPLSDKDVQRIVNSISKREDSEDIKDLTNHDVTYEELSGEKI